jgi:DtxR family transcriptional regulator, Mn-dependent transcriptional regulator
MPYTITDQEILNLQKQFPSALNYLTTITVIQRESGKVGNTRLASQLGVSKPAANQAMGRLKKLGLTEQNPYGEITLTKEGKRFAYAVLRRHYLIEHLLISKLAYPWEKSDDEAQRLQASLSEEFTEYLCEYFNHPDTCPHGNPFPGSSLEKELLEAERLSRAALNEELILIRITEVGETIEGLLPFCYSNELLPGCHLTVKGISNGEVTMEINGRESVIPSDFTEYLCYKKA